MNPLIDNDGQLYLYDDFINKKQSDTLFGKLIEELQWSSETIKIYGKIITVPRLVCWYGNEGAVYSYSGIKHLPLAWTSTLQHLKHSIEQHTQQKFNSVLANLYRNETDSMGWHADKEKELGKNPYIASLSLGEQRRFNIRHNKTQKVHNILLRHGSLLVMAGSFQHHWQHCIPKSRKPKKTRINLTFRQIIIPGG
ncbi:MAG: alpha-ketoglutarate-dependent dioxygenase AlkB [Gammaproteobacteria bacterium]|nr:alpha-ketoglutarate-dependent dioxygenase AlkB [Gammaproteobacteria bacterium]